MTLVPGPVRRLLQAAGVNRAVAYALMGQAAAIALQPLTALLLAVFLSDKERGYYFSFGAAVGLQAFFELGLGMATLQFISHEAGYLTWAADGTLAGDPAAKSRLASVVRLSVLWYTGVAVLVVGVVLPAGWMYLLARDDGTVAWRLPWVWTVLVTAAGLITVPGVQFLNGCGRMTEGVRAMALQRAGTSLALCLLLAAGGRLYAWPAAQTVGVAGLGYWLIRHWGPTLRDAVRPVPGGPTVSWRRDVWPFQWKIAVGGMAFFLTSQLFTLVLFDETDAGKAEAGRMGMSLLVMNVIIHGSLTWVGTRVPLFGGLVGRRDWAGLDRVFRRVFVQSAVVAAVAAAAIWVVFAGLRAGGWEFGQRFAERVLPPLPLGLLLANAVVQTLVHGLLSYLRAHKRDPFLWVNLAFTAATVAAVFTVGRAYGSLGMAAALLGLNTVICLGGGGMVFARCRRAWHAEPLAA